ncbi:MAG: diacylglycerol kinase [Candidatus Omnitrophota bacterium]|nr:diacylglycerol kinase [Candidatus Omnitrophota bacterium]MBU1894385.1 diacylglycerol kinase [Candidatus Omnitrophota bacterium]
MNTCKKPEDSYSKSFIRSVSAALEGVVHTLRAERNMRLHFLIGFLAIIAGIYFSLNSIELMLLCFAVTFVLVCEMFNTAIEYLTDLISKKFHPGAKVIKDIAAGAVFVSSVNAVVVGYILLYKRLQGCVGKSFFIIKQSSWHITFIVLLVVVGLVLLIKIIRKEKDLLRGGMPSGHSAVAFAVWVVVSLVTENTMVSLLVLVMAVLIAKSRMAMGIHSLAQVVAGSVIGTLVTLLIFQLLS